MKDALDADGIWAAIRNAGLDLPDRPRPSDLDGRLVNAFLKCEVSQDGEVRGRRNAMLDDSDVHWHRQIKACVGGVAASVTGDPAVFVSVSAAHQGPDGGGPVAAIVDLGTEPAALAVGGDQRRVNSRSKISCPAASPRRSNRVRGRKSGRGAHPACALRRPLVRCRRPACCSAYGAQSVASRNVPPRRNRDATSAANSGVTNRRLRCLVFGHGSGKNSQSSASDAGRNQVGQHLHPVAAQHPDVVHSGPARGGAGSAPPLACRPRQPAGSPRAAPTAIATVDSPIPEPISSTSGASRSNSAGPSIGPASSAASRYHRSACVSNALRCTALSRPPRGWKLTTRRKWAGRPSPGSRCGSASPA